jgi:hypothetical protein
MSASRGRYHAVRVTAGQRPQRRDALSQPRPPREGFGVSRCEVFVRPEDAKALDIRPVARQRPNERHGPRRVGSVVSFEPFGECHVVTRMPRDVRLRVELVRPIAPRDALCRRIR